MKLFLATLAGRITGTIAYVLMVLFTLVTLPVAVVMLLLFGKVAWNKK